MAGLELLSDQGYRVDGRRAGELRKIQARMGVFAQADGSAYIEQGNTKALAVVYGPHEANPRLSIPRPARPGAGELPVQLGHLQHRRAQAAAARGPQVLRAGPAAAPDLRGGHPHAAAPALPDRHLRAGPPGGRRHLRGLRERRHAGRPGRRHPHARLRVRLLSRLRGRHGPGGPEPRGGGGRRSPAGPGAAACLGPDRAAGDGRPAARGPPGAGSGRRRPRRAGCARPAGPRSAAARPGGLAPAGGLTPAPPLPVRNKAFRGSLFGPTHLLPGRLAAQPLALALTLEVRQFLCNIRTLSLLERKGSMSLLVAKRGLRGVGMGL